MHIKDLQEFPVVAFDRETLRKQRIKYTISKQEVAQVAGVPVEVLDQIDRQEGSRLATDKVMRAYEKIIQERRKNRAVLHNRDQRSVSPKLQQ